MNHEELLESWKRDSCPVEEKVPNVIRVLEAVFEKWEWHKRRPYLIVRDRRLVFYRKNVNQQDTLLAPDGAFSIPTRNGRIVIKKYLKDILTLKVIAETAERYMS